MPINEVADKATSLVDAGQYFEARPYLSRLLQFAPSGRKRELVSFYLALSFVDEHNQTGNDRPLEIAATRYEQFIREFPDSSSLPIAELNLADIYQNLGGFKQALVIYKRYYNRPPEGTAPEALLSKIMSAYAAQEDWAEGADWFRRGLQLDKGAPERTMAACYLMLMYAEEKRLDQVLDMLPELKGDALILDTPAFNNALIRIGDIFYEDNNHTVAGLFYAKARPYEVLAENLSKRIERLKASYSSAGSQLTANTLAEIKQAERYLRAVERTENYTPLLRWRTARIQLEDNRNWEAYWVLRELHANYPRHIFGEDILFAYFLVADRLELDEETQKLAAMYLTNRNYRQYRTQAALLLAQSYIRRDNIKSLFALTQNYLRDYAGDETADYLVLQLGLNRMKRYEYIELLNEFTSLKEQYGASLSGEAIDYILSMANLLTENYKEAMRGFEQLLLDRKSVYYEDALYRKALTYYGMQNLDEAKNALLNYVEQFPRSNLRAEAEYNLGDIAEYQRDPGRAMLHFRNVEKHAHNQEQIIKAFLRNINIQLSLSQSNEVISNIRRFLLKHGDEPTSIAVFSKYAKLLEEQRDFGAALDIYQSALQRFATDPSAHQLDDLLLTYMDADARIRAYPQATQGFIAELKSGKVSTEFLVRDRGFQFSFFEDRPELDPILRYLFSYDDDFRSRVLDNPQATLDKLSKELNTTYSGIPLASAKDIMQGLRAEPNPCWDTRLKWATAQQNPAGKRSPSPQDLLLLQNPDNFEALSGRCLLWLVEAQAKSQPDNALQNIRTMRERFAETSLDKDVHWVKGQLHAQLKQWDNAVKEYTLLSRRYADEPIASRALIEAGRLQTEQGNYEGARETLARVLMRQDWRGEPHAEALLELGRAYARNGLLTQAHAYFERVMLGYVAFREPLAAAYYEDIQVLRKMDDEANANKLLEAFKDLPNLQNTEAGTRIRKEFL